MPITFTIPYMQLQKNITFLYDVEKLELKSQKCVEF